MVFLLQILLTVGIIWLTYLLYLWTKILSARKKCSWVPAVPRVPILGSVFEFGPHTEMLNDISRLTNNSSKLCYVEILGIWNIIIKDHEFMEFVMTSNAILNKSHDYEYLHGWLGTGLLTAPGPKWKKRRRIITPAFHFSILEQFVEVFESNGKIMIEKLYKEAVDKASVNIYQYVTDCALDIISESAMGVNVKTQENKNQDYVFAVKDMCRITVDRSFSTWKRFNFLFKFSEDYKKQNKYLKTLHGFTNAVIEKRKNEFKDLKGKENLKDEYGRKRKLAFLDLLLNSTIDGKPLSQDDIREEVDTFMFEGHDTTSSGISFTLYLLANHQEIQKASSSKNVLDSIGQIVYGKYCCGISTAKNSQFPQQFPTICFDSSGGPSCGSAYLKDNLVSHNTNSSNLDVGQIKTNRAREEQKKIYGKDRDAPTSYQDLQDMKYLEMVIKESLRLFPPVPVVTRQLTRDINYKGHIIPKDTVLSLFIYGINRDPDYHSSPEEFKPERFESNDTLPFSFVPFSAGPRNCIGQKFAMLEMKSVISRMLRHFELYPTNPPHKLELVSEAVLKSLSGVKIMLKKHNWQEHDC